MISRSNNRERDIRKRTAIRDLLIAFSNTFFLKIGHKVRGKMCAGLQFIRRFCARRVEEHNT